MKRNRYNATESVREQITCEHVYTDSLVLQCNSCGKIWAMSLQINAGNSEHYECPEKCTTSVLS